MERENEILLTMNTTTQCCPFLRKHYGALLLSYHSQG